MIHMTFFLFLFHFGFFFSSFLFSFISFFLSRVQVFFCFLFFSSSFFPCFFFQSDSFYSPGRGTEIWLWLRLATPAAGLDWFRFSSGTRGTTPAARKNKTKHKKTSKVTKQKTATLEIKEFLLKWEMTLTQVVRLSQYRRVTSVCVSWLLPITVTLEHFPCRGTVLFKKKN